MTNRGSFCAHLGPREVPEISRHVPSVAFFLVRVHARLAQRQREQSRKVHAEEAVGAHANGPNARRIAGQFETEFPTRQQDRLKAALSPGIDVVSR